MGYDEHASATQNAINIWSAPATSHGQNVAGPTSFSATPMVKTIPPMGAMVPNWMANAENCPRVRFNSGRYPSCSRYSSSLRVALDEGASWGGRAMMVSVDRSAGEVARG